MNRNAHLNALALLLVQFVGSVVFAAGHKPIRDCSILFDKLDYVRGSELDVAAATESTQPQKNIVGFLRDKYGKINPLYSDSKAVLSQRILGDNIFFSGWNDLRNVELISLKIESPQNAAIDDRSPEYELLPAPLIQLFAEGKILVTDNHSSHQSKYQVLMATAPNGSTPEGRTGVLMQNGDPILVAVKGKDYLIEIKGIGAPDGGFDYDYISNRGSIRGGVEADFARFEFESNAIDRRSSLHYSEGNAVIAIGVISFDSPQGRQGYLIRLTPGSVRASFRNNSAIARLDSMPGQLVQKFGESWGSLIGRGLIPLSHYENLVAIDNLDDFAITDYQDVAPIGVFPYYDVNPEVAAVRSLDAVREVPGFEYDQHFDLFKIGLIKGLQGGRQIPTDVIDSIKGSKTTNEIGEILWERFLILMNFRQRSEFGWLPWWLQYTELNGTGDAKVNFSEDTVRDIVTIHSRNNYKISKINDEIAEAKNHLIDANLEYQKLKNDQKSRDTWKTEKIRANGWRDDQQAERLLETHLQELKDYSERLRQAVKRKVETLNLLKLKNKGLEETGFSLQGLIALVQSKIYYEEVAKGISFRSKYADIPTDNSLSQLQTLKGHLSDEIRWLRQAEKIASASEQIEIERNIGIAQQRLTYLQSLGPYEFHLQTLEDPYYVLVQAMLPYQTKHFSKNLLAQSKVFKRVFKTVERLKAEHRI